MTPRRKIITAVFVFLLLGAIVNVAVAWGCAIYSDGFGIARRVVHRQRTAQEDIQNAGYCLEFIPAASMEVSSGFPFRCFWARLSESIPDTNDPGWHWVVSGGLALETPDELEFVPMTPRWPFVTINTLFYAAVLWALFAAPFALRRWWGDRRIKRGLCPACAYPVGASDVCTECGKQLPSPSR